MSWLVALFVLAKPMVTLFVFVLVTIVDSSVGVLYRMYQRRFPWRTQLNKSGYQWVRYLTATQTACLDKEMKQHHHYNCQGGHYLLLVLVISVDLSVGNSIKLGKAFRLGSGGEGACGRLLSWNAMVVCLGGKGGKIPWSMVTFLVAWI